MSDSTPTPTDRLLRAIEEKAYSRANDLLHAAVTRIWNDEPPPAVPGLNRGYLLKLAGVGLTEGSSSENYKTWRKAALDAVAAHLTKKALERIASDYVAAAEGRP